MTTPIREIKGGLYLVLDPMPELQITLPKVKAALDGGVDAIQIWNHWNGQKPDLDFIVALCDLAHQYHVPVLINEHWQLLQKLPLDGVHFDAIPVDLTLIKKQINRPFIIGITCGNDKERMDWAICNKLNYVSFCSMFSSSTSNSCELVRPDLIKQARALTDMPIYVAGGITYYNLASLLPLGISGVAIVSGIMKSEDPQLAARKFKQCLSNKEQRTNS